MRLTVKDIEAVAGDRVFKAYKKKLAWSLFGLFILTLAAGVIDTTFSMLLVLAGVSFYLMVMMKMSKDQTKLSRKLYEQAQNEEINLA